MTMEFEAGSPQWQKFMMDMFGMKREGMKDYGLHIDFEAMDVKCDFKMMLVMLGDDMPDLQAYLLWHMKR